MKLINTIEINPYDYANTEYQCPNGSSKDLPYEWNKFWRRCISDRNIENLKAIKEGSYLVDITSIGDKELEVIIKNQLKEVDLADYKEQVSSICGGIVIKVDEEILLEPTCCGDIGNIQEWENIFEEKSDNWKQLWIGHPWIYYRMKGGIVELSDYYETNIVDLKEVNVMLTIQEKDLFSKLKLIKKQQIEFEQRVRIILDKLAIKNSKEIAKLIMGNT